MAELTGALVVFMRFTRVRAPEVWLTLKLLSEPMLVAMPSSRQYMLLFLASRCSQEAFGAHPWLVWS